MIRIRHLSIYLSSIYKSDLFVSISISDKRQKCWALCLEKISIFLNQINPQNFEFYNYKEKIAA